MFVPYKKLLIYAFFYLEILTFSFSDNTLKYRANGFLKRVTKTKSFD